MVTAMEVKWISIAMAVVFGSMFAAIGVGEYNKSQCQMEGIRAGLTDTYINNICGKSR